MLMSYLKLAIKVLARRKFFTFVSLFGICLTLVVLMVAAAIGDHFFAPHAPESKLDRILGVYQVELSDGEGSRRTSPAGYELLDKTIRNLPGVEAVSIGEMPDRLAVYADGNKLELFRRRVDGNFWHVFDFKLLAGELYTQADEENARFVSVINLSTARALFGSPGNALHKKIDVDGQTFEVVGVVEDVPFSGFRSFGDVWAPISTNKSSAYRHGFSGANLAFVLARDSDQFPAIKAEFQSRLAAMPMPASRPEMREPQWTTKKAALETPMEAIVSSFRLPSVTWLRAILVLVALLVMVLPAINLVNLNLSRILERASEIGVRRAFGARRGTLVFQFLVENLVLTLIGGALGLAVSALVLAGINATGIVPRSEFALNFRVFAVGLVASVVLAMLSGVYPAWRMSRLQPVDALKGTA